MKFSYSLGLLLTSTFVTAAPSPQLSLTSRSQCSSGIAVCCSSIVAATDQAVGAITAILGVLLPSTDINVGLSCSPITVVGTGSSDCAGQPACCGNDNFNGLMSIGCIPIQL
ncbi:hypothetical protein BP6252_14060 [Coleophoma cylindrospora]|uniref:Hydrophobin n=1 Tax=Coleophoma cylindrospora TaxID=1849047 RepID=A0A3D8Q5I8_9HELO|nr:hypothetical protein BP6252_14060 [Coleophoma cylindrospora]